MDLARNYLGQLITTIGPRELRIVLFDLLPAKVNVEADKADAIIEELRSFYTYLGREFELPQAEACLRVLGDGAVAKLQTTLADPANFGMAKSVLGLGAEMGFDMESREGIEEFMREMQGRPLPDSVRLPGDPPPLFTPATRKAAVERKNKRKAEKKARKKKRARRIADISSPAPGLPR